MTVAVDATGTKLVGGSSAVTSIDYTGITVGSGLSNGALTAWLMFGVGATAPTGFAGAWDNTGTPQTMFLVGSQTFSGTGGRATIAQFGLRNPTAGNKTLHFSWTGTGSFPVACALSLTGVEQSSDANAFKNFNSNTGNVASNGTLSATITSATGDMVLGAFSDCGSPAATPINGTIVFQDTTSSGADNSGNRQSGAATVTVTGTNSGSGTEACVVTGFDVAAASAAAAVVDAPRRRFLRRHHAPFEAPRRFVGWSPPKLLIPHRELILPRRLKVAA